MRWMLCYPVLGLVLLACNGAADAPVEPQTPPPVQGDETPTEPATEAAPIVVSSAAFGNGTAIPVEFTCEGAERLPPLAWSALPLGAASLAVIVDDPDAPVGTWVHWVAIDLPADLTGLASDTIATLTDATETTNSWGNVGWGVPCPPKGHGPHRYFFRVYALDTRLDLPATTTRIDVDRAMQGHILSEGVMMGTFERH